MQNQKYKLLKYVFSGLLASLMVASCSNSGNGVTATSSPVTASSDVVVSPVTIDNSDAVEFCGSSGSATVYVHNNSLEPINDIKYEVKSNTTSNTLSATAKASRNKLRTLLGKTTNTSNDNVTSVTSQCENLPGNTQTGCPVTVSWECSNGSVCQGSIIITAKYAFQNKQKSFTGLVDYKPLDLTAEGHRFGGNVALSGFGNKQGYATLHMNTSHDVKINSLSINNSALSISQGDIAGKTLQACFDQAIEVSGVTASNDTNQQSVFTKSTNKRSPSAFSATLTAISTSVKSGAKFSATASIGVAPTNDGPILTAGILPLINSALSNPQGKIYVVNSGNADASLGSQTVSGLNSSDIALTSDCGLSLPIGGSCTVNLTVANNSDGSATFNLPYTNLAGTSSVTLSQGITWYNGVGAPLVGMSLPSFNFNSGTTATGILTISNPGGYDFSNISLAATHTGSATPTITNLSCNSGGSWTGTGLKIGGTCSASVSISDASAELGNITITVTASYTKSGSPATYSRILVVPYTSNSANTTLAFENVNSMSIIGDGINSASQIITLHNTGIGSAFIQGPISLNPQLSYASIVNNTCPATVGAQESCQITVKLGPKSVATQVTDLLTLNVSYTDQGNQNPVTSSTSIGYTITPDSQNITLSSHMITGNENGSGTQASPYIFNGNNPAIQSVTLNYKNEGTNQIAITGVNNSNSAIAWQIDQLSSTCYAGGALPGPAIAVNSSCTITFKNVLRSNILAVSNIGSVYVEDLQLPTLVFRDDSTPPPHVMFQLQPKLSSGAGTIYVTANQATVTNLVSENNNIVTVEHNLANATGYGPITISSNMEKYFTSATPGSNCSSNNAQGITTQNCTLAQIGGTASGSVQYLVESGYLGSTLTTLFGIVNANNQTVAISPLSTTTVLY